MLNKKYQVIIALIISCVLLACFAKKAVSEKYSEDWQSLQTHPDPEWFRDAKFGIYMHWGPYSVPEFGNEWYPRWMYINKAHKKRGNYYQYHEENFGNPADIGYKDLIPEFTAEHFDANEWAELFKKAGARFAGPVAEHHDGFAMWDSDLTEWDAADKGPRRDLVGEMAEAFRQQDLKFVTSFHHARKWWYYETSYTTDEQFDTKDPEYAGVYKIYPPFHNIDDPPSTEYMQAWEEKVVEVIDKYHPDLLWFDSGLSKEKFWRSAADEFQSYKKSMLAYYYNKSAGIGKEVAVTYKHEDLPKGAGILDFERGRNDKLSDFVWLTDTSIDEKSWSHVKNPRYKPVNEIIDILIDIVSKNGCLLLNIGPKADGTIPTEMKQKLLGIGEWLDLNGEAIYKTRPWIIAGEGPTKEVGGAFSEKKNKVTYTGQDIRFTTRDNYLYSILMAWPENNTVTIESLGENSVLLDKTIVDVTLIGSAAELDWSINGQGLHVTLPIEKPCEHAFVLAIKLK